MDMKEFQEKIKIFLCERCILKGSIHCRVSDLGLIECIKDAVEHERILNDKILELSDNCIMR